MYQGCVLLLFFSEVNHGAESEALLKITSPSDHQPLPLPEDRLNWKVLVSFSIFTNKDALSNPQTLDQTE